MIRRNRYGDMSLLELDAARVRIEHDPANRNPPGSFYIYTVKARRNLHQIAQAVADVLAARRRP